MKQCWPEGDLRAYLDGELPAESQQRISGHLETCAACRAAYRELSERAVRVTNLLAMLPETPSGVTRMLPTRAHHGRQWAVAALSLAAALAIGFVVMPKRGGAPVEIVSIPAVAAPATVEPPPAAAKPAVSHRTARHAVAQPQVLRADFLRLDDEPLETGTLVRVSAENGDVQADLIVGPDGRAHAIRLVSNQ